MPNGKSGVGEGQKEQCRTSCPALEGFNANSLARASLGLGGWCLIPENDT